VRSATLDTWLPEQVAFIQCMDFLLPYLYKKRYFSFVEINFGVYLLTAMGNEKANSHWEAELPPNYDRVGIENFIRAKYDSLPLAIPVNQVICFFHLLFRQHMWLTLCLKCRYEDKRWVPRNGASRPSSGARDEKSSESQASATRSGHVQRLSFGQHCASPAATSKIAPVASRMPTQVLSWMQALPIFYFDSTAFR
jgi:stromal membrane-associated protein